MVKVLEVEPTPNPDALKFIVDKRLVDQGAKSFDSPEAGQNDPLAQALFALGPIRSVFYMDRFVTVSKPPQSEWNGLEQKIISTIQDKAEPVAEKTVEATSLPAGEGLLARVNQVLNDNVLPALAGDGGGLQILEFDEKNFTLVVQYQGACGSCPSSTSGTLYAIQNLLQRLVDERIQVIPG